MRLCENKALENINKYVSFCHSLKYMLFESMETFSSAPQKKNIQFNYMIAKQ